MISLGLKEALAHTHLAGVRLRAVRTGSNPAMGDDKWAGSASHWACLVYTGDRAFQTTYSMGSAHKKPPMVEDLLGCLATDASCLGDSFEGFCGDWGYDTDSRSALDTYERMQRQSAQFAEFCGELALEVLQGWDW